MSFETFINEEYNDLLIERDGEVSVIKINRPEALNALNDSVITELNLAFGQLEREESTRAIILTGAGEKAFVAGADIGELARCNPLSGIKTSRKGQSLMFQIQWHPKPVIAAINGFALGGGCEIALACDIRIASDKAKLGLPEVNLGILPGYGGTQRLPRLVGLGKGKELIFTGEMIDAQEALRIGLVNKVVPAADLMKEAKEMARKIASKGPVAVRLAKQAINFGANVDLSSGCIFETDQFGVVCATADKAEGTTAFLEKRKPEFKGK
jgi:enoyl-CoA hydratase